MYNIVPPTPHIQISTVTHKVGIIHYNTLFYMNMINTASHKYCVPTNYIQFDHIKITPIVNTVPKF